MSIKLENWVDKYGLTIQLLIYYINIILMGIILLGKSFAFNSLNFIIGLIICIIGPIVIYLIYRFIKLRKKSRIDWKILNWIKDHKFIITTILFYINFLIATISWAGTYYEDLVYQLGMSIMINVILLFLYWFSYFIAAKKGSTSFEAISFVSGLFFQFQGWIMKMPLTALSAFLYSAPCIIFFIIVSKIAGLITEKHFKQALLSTILCFSFLLCIYIISFIFSLSLQN